MDEIIRRIYSTLKKDDIMVVLSDHGMANEGGHGGSSHMELMTPALFITSHDLISNMHNFDDIKQNEQIDFVSTLFCLYNLPIPNENQGVMFINDLVDLVNNSNIGSEAKIKTEIEIFNCLNKNLEQLNNLFSLFKENEESILKIELDRIRSNFKNALKERNQAKLNELLNEQNKKFESLMRKEIRNKQNDDKNNQDQLVYMILSLVWMTIVIIF